MRNEMEENEMEENEMKEDIHISFYIRFTEDPFKDVKKGTSFFNTGVTDFIEFKERSEDFHGDYKIIKGVYYQKFNDLWGFQLNPSLKLDEICLEIQQIITTYAPLYNKHGYATPVLFKGTYEGYYRGFDHFSKSAIIRIPTTQDDGRNWEF